MGYDDTDFSYTLIENGMHSFANPLFQLLLLNSEEYSSTIFTGADDDPLYRVRNIKATYDKHMDRNEDGSVDLDGFRKKYHCPEQIILPREKEIDADKEIVGRQTEFIKQSIKTQKENTKNTMKYFL